MNLRALKKAVGFLSGTPFHPQWLMHGDKEKFLAEVAGSLRGTVLDIGCAHKTSKKYLDKDVQYIGLDYYTAQTMYSSRPDIYANAENLPFAAKSMDAILLLDVLEHVADPGLCMQEIERVLAAGGKLVLNVPFIYPVHDAPFDFQRWTQHGLQALLAKQGLSIDREAACGNSLVTSGLLLNLALCKTVINSIEKRHPGFLIIILLPVLIPIINICAWLSGLLFPPDHFMPYRYHITATKPSSAG